PSGGRRGVRRTARDLRGCENRGARQPVRPATEELFVTISAERLAGSRFGLIADAHIHPDRPLPEALTALFAGVDAVLTLGDVGEAMGLDALEAFAPVTGVVGGDDQAGDPRLAGEGLRVEMR